MILNDFLRRRSLLGCCAPLLLPTASQALSKPALPARIYRIVTSSPAGGTVNAIAQLLARHLSTLTGRTFLVDNRPGANGWIAAQAVVHNASNDVNILIGLSSQLMINQLTYTNMPVNLQTDLARLSLICTGTNYLTVNPQKTPTLNLRALLEHAQRHPNLSMGSYGKGSYPHLVSQRLNQLFCSDFVHVPYTGEAPMIYALLRGELDVGWASAKHLKANPKRLLALACHSPQRVPEMAHVPTFAEAGLPDKALSLRGWIGTVVSSQMSTDLKHQLAQAIAHVNQHTDFPLRCAEMGVTVVRNSSPESFEAFYANDYGKWERLINSLQPTAA